ncbi:MAG: hypothetical protein EA000_20385 [Oscillatoriales cyanobacterium]|nr:MAG: hypothetical protein EA000_20385 [Oscillatoriales cyanobacterium]
MDIPLLKSEFSFCCGYLQEYERIGNGEWGMGNGEWGMGNGEWGMGNGEWGMGNGEWVISC